MKNPMWISTLRKLCRRAWHDVLAWLFAWPRRRAGAFRLRMTHNTLTIVIPEGTGIGVPPNTQQLLDELVNEVWATTEGKDALWKYRAVAWLQAVVPPLLELHKGGHAVFNADAILGLASPLAYFRLMDHPEISQRSRDTMRTFVTTVPGFDPVKMPDKQGATFVDMYGYMTMYALSNREFINTVADRVLQGLESRAPRGGVYRVPRTRHFAVTRRDQVLSFETSEGKRVDVPFGSVRDAATALDRVGQRLLSRRPLVWSMRLLALGVCWLLVSSYLQVRSKQAAQAQETAVAGAPAGGPLASLPDVNASFQALPAAPPALPVPVSQPHDASDAGVPASTAPLGGLSGFGLDVDGSGGAAPSALPPSAPEASSSPPIALAPTVTSGPGCDPSLAFKAPVR